jgi:hypothetical protein
MLYNIFMHDVRRRKDARQAAHKSDVRRSLIKLIIVITARRMRVCCICLHIIGLLLNPTTKDDEISLTPLCVGAEQWSDVCS